MLTPDRITEDVISMVARVLQYAAAFDQRKVGEADITAWSLAVGDMREDALTEAVVAYYCETGTDERTGRRPFIMPADVIKRVKAAREAAIAHDVQNAIAPITRTEANGFIAELRARTGQAAEVRRPPACDLPKEITPPKYVGKPGQAGFEVAEPRPETAEVRRQLKTIRHRPAAADEDRELGHARALLALVPDRDEWEAKAVEALGGAAESRAVTLKAAELLREHDRAAHTEHREAS
ncbi:hypothetical protein [Actinomadura violacea]|uniref:Uncharacterized protein n=1 Tax=Actinomadura violacea TaxID=2819934 RepID=A0ABS3S061_9ACTN|nr:hypothetical protein [Actinomadura violacea]MBO2461650.1 hypothetical protein [Actinomadura violacea]